MKMNDCEYMKIIDVTCKQKKEYESDLCGNCLSKVHYIREKIKNKPFISTLGGLCKRWFDPLTPKSDQHIPSPFDI